MAQVKIYTFNNQQLGAFREILQAIHSQNSGESRDFYLDGPGGTGKADLYNTLNNYIEGNGGKVFSFATTGTRPEF